MNIEIAADYNEEQIHAFEAGVGRLVDFTLVPAWTRAAEVSGYAKGVRVVALRDGKPVALVQGTLRSQFGVGKLLLGSTSGVGVLWQADEVEAGRACVGAAIGATRPQVVHVFSSRPVDLKGVDWTVSNSFQIRLDQPMEAILASMEKRARHAIRRAERLGVEVDEATDEDGMNQAYDVIESAARDRNFPVPPRAYSLALHREFEIGGAQRCFVARLGKRVVSAIAILGYGAMVTWWKGGSLPEGYRASAGNALQVAAMRWARSLGFRVYDLGGTDASDPTYAGIHQFKESFGGTRTDTYLGTRASVVARGAVALRKALRCR